MWQLIKIHYNKDSLKRIKLMKKIIKNTDTFLKIFIICKERQKSVGVTS